MSRKRTQKGSGIFNRIRAAFGTKKVAPQPSQPAVQQNTRKHESYKNAMKRSYVFLYAKLKGQQPDKAQRFLPPQQEQEVKQVLLNADREGKDADTIIREVFHADPATFDREFSDWELYMPDKYLNKGTEYERLAYTISGSLGRFLAAIKGSPKNITYTSNYVGNQCEIPVAGNLVTSLSDNLCVSILTPGNKEQFEEGKGAAYPVSYIVVKPEFFPKGTTSGGPISIVAKRLPVVSFLLDAFQQNGVLEIEPTLKATLQREAPELLQFGAQQPIVLLTPAYLGDASTTKGRFIVIDPRDFTRGRNVVNVKNLKSNPTITDVFTKRRVYFMDPITMFDMRDRIPQLWLANYGNVNTSVYRSLTPHEKLAFCFMQYIKFQEVYSLHRQAVSTNNATTVARKAAAAADRARKEVFLVNYETGANPYDLAENFQEDDIENLQQLVNLQQKVLGSALIKTSADVRRVASKFDLRRALNKGPVVQNYFGPSGPNAGPNVRALATRRQRVTRMMSPENVQGKRNEIVQRYKTALKTSAKTSLLPNFMRSKTARNANKKVYLNRIQSIQNELRAFNEEHGIPTSSGFGYEF